jgi:hypothetical protein
MTPDSENNFGPQPLDRILDELGLANSVLVEASTEQLTHKQVQKGRKGRRLTPNIQHKIVNALNAAADGERKYAIGDLFNYGNRKP